MSDTLEKIRVGVGYGPNFQEFDFKAGSTVNDVVNNAYVKEILGYDDAKNMGTCINGEKCEPSAKLHGGESLEVIKKAGQKA